MLEGETRSLITASASAAAELLRWISNKRTIPHLGKKLFKMVSDDKAMSSAKPDPPLISLPWQNIRVSATVVGVANGGVECELYPRLDERLPHRKGVRAALQINPKVVGKGKAKAAAGAAAAALRPHPGGALHGLSQASRAALNKSRVVAGGVRHQHQQKAAAVTSALVGGHRRVNLGNGVDKSMQCPICRKGFTKTTYLKRHIQAHSGVRPHKCEICGWGERFISNILGIVVATAAAANFVAGVGAAAGAAFVAASCCSFLASLEVAAAAETSALQEVVVAVAAVAFKAHKHLPPLLLSLGFHQHSNLKRHMASHALGGDNSYKCPYCTAFFSTKSVLSVHMREAHGDTAGASIYPNLEKGAG